MRAPTRFSPSVVTRLMSEFDETDAEILRLLVEDARRPYKDIAERVNLSAPAVSDRIARLRESGVIDRFTVNVDRSKLFGQESVLLEVDARVGAAARVADELRTVEDVEHVVRTSDSRVVAEAYLDEEAVVEAVADLPADAVERYDVHRVLESDWRPTFDVAAFAVECVECGRPVTNEGVVVERDGDRYHLCCPSCEERFDERYDRLAAGATED